MAGKLIVFEGIDGSGKDTQIQKLVSFLEEKGQGVSVFVYPHLEKPIGNLINQFLTKDIDFSPEIQFLLYTTDMLKDKETILQLIQEGVTVILNRYVTSSLAYQGAQGFSLKKGLEFIKTFSYPQPDMILYFNISAAISIKRKTTQKNEVDRFESIESLQEDVLEMYQTLIRQRILGNWIIINGEQSRERVFEDVKKHF